MVFAKHMSLCCHVCGLVVSLIYARPSSIGNLNLRSILCESLIAVLVGYSLNLVSKRVAVYLWFGSSPLEMLDFPKYVRLKISTALTFQHSVYETAIAHRH